MKNEHILTILDDKALRDLSENELKTIAAHAAECADCGRHFAAAKISSVLLQSSAFETFAPPPFFQAKVLANLREKQISVNSFAAVRRMWKASKALVAAMAAAVLVLFMLTVFAPKLNQVSSANADVFDNYSTETVILNEKIPAKEPTNEQVFQIVYGAGK